MFNSEAQPSLVNENNFSLTTDGWCLIPTLTVIRCTWAIGFDPWLHPHTAPLCSKERQRTPCTWKFISCMNHIFNSSRISTNWETTHLVWSWNSLAKTVKSSVLPWVGARPHTCAHSLQTSLWHWDPLSAQQGRWAGAAFLLKNTRISTQTENVSIMVPSSPLDHARVTQ